MLSERSRLISLRARYNFSCPYSGERDGVYPHNEYSVVAENSTDLDGSLLGLCLTTAGRFGNALTVVPNGVAIAQQKGLKFIRLPDVDGLQIEESISIEDIAILPTRGALPRGGAFLQGPCGDLNDFPGVSSINAYDCIRKFIRPILTLPPAPHRSELVVHIRSGDIFSNYVHPDYVQPPLSFYTLVIKDLQSRCLIDRVRVVFEDRLNPCVDALESYLCDSPLLTTMQSSNFTTDLVSMIDANYFCFGYGTLGPAVCLLSNAMANVYHFQGGQNLSGIRIQVADELIEYTTITEYIPKGTWANTEEQRATMINYPEESLRCFRA